MRWKSDRPTDQRRQIDKVSNKNFPPGRRRQRLGSSSVGAIEGVPPYVRIFNAKYLLKLTTTRGRKYVHIGTAPSNFLLAFSTHLWPMNRKYLNRKTLFFSFSNFAAADVRCVFGVLQGEAKHEKIYDGQISDQEIAASPMASFLISPRRPSLLWRGCRGHSNTPGKETPKALISSAPGVGS